jgi:hypothetical protein
MSRRRASSWRSRSSRSGPGGRSCWRFMDAGTSRSTSWFFQYNVGLHTPSSWATACALSWRVHNPMTAACFIAGGRAIALDRPTMRTCSSGCDS